MQHNQHTESQIEKRRERNCDLFDRNKLARVKVHAHVHSTEGAGTDQLALPPPEGRGVVGALGRRRRKKGLVGEGLGEEADSRLANGGADPVDDSGEGSIVVGGGRVSENE